MYTLNELITVRYNSAELAVPHKVLALDPGNCTGYAIFTDGECSEAGQIETIQEHQNNNGVSCLIDWDAVFVLLEQDDWDYVVMENYRIYSHKLDRHTFSEVPTLRLIGGIDAWCDQRRTPLFYTMATNAKGFVTDAKLKAWGLNKTHALRHSADAIRHAIYFLLVTYPLTQQKNGGR